MSPISWLSEEFRPGLVSVIVPTFNRAQMVIRSLDSVFAQTYRPIELIIVDDGSTDDTEIVLEAWAQQRRSVDFEIKIVRQANQGAQVARNCGLRESIGEYIQFLDSDDQLIDHKFALQTQCLKQTGADYCYGHTEIIGQSGELLWLQGKPRHNHRPWVTEHAWHTNSPLFLRRVCSAIGPWDTSLTGGQEYEYAARIKAAEFRSEFLPRVLDRAFMHDGPSISGQESQKYAQTLELATQRVLALLPRYGKESRIERKHMRNNLIAIALRYARNGDGISARRCLAAAANLSGRGQLNPVRALLIATRFAPERVVLEAIRLLVRSVRRIGLSGRIRRFLSRG